MKEGLESEHILAHYYIWIFGSKSGNASRKMENSISSKMKRMSKRCFLWQSVGNVYIHQKYWCRIFCDTFIWDYTILPAGICLGTPSGTVQLVCEWVICCPWMKSSVVNERHSLNSITQMKGGDKEEQHNYPPEG